MNKVKEEIKKKEQDEAVLKGRPGKGHKAGYARFCKYCFTEFMIEIDKCTNCSKETITFEVGIQS